MATITIKSYERLGNNGEPIDEGILTVECELEITEAHYEKIDGERNDWVGDKIKFLEITDAQFKPDGSKESVEIPIDEIEDYVLEYVNEHIQNYI